MDKAIDALKSPALSLDQKHAIVEMLLKLPVDETKREAVTEALRPLASGNTLSVSLFRALCMWGEESDLVMLAGYWEKLDLSTKDLLAKRMQKLKSAEVAEALVNGVIHSGYAPDQAMFGVLRAMGPAAESSAISLLT